MTRYATVGGITALLPIFCGLVTADPSVPVAYCSTLNTAETDANFSIFQSQGLCYGLCNDDGYALGIVQESNCWCSNYVPGDTESTSNCESSCPGYPTDYCGGDGTFGYMKLSAAVSGTQGASSSTSSTSTSTSTSTSKTTSSSSESETSTAEPITTSSDEESTTSSSTTTEAPSVVTSVKTVTSDGQIVYQTITSTAVPIAAGSSGGLSGGAIAGLAIGILLILLLFAIGAFLYRRHRIKKQQEMEGAPLAGGMAHRRGSSAGIMSKTGTISSSGYGMAMEEDAYGSHRMSMKPMDPRLDPKQTFGLYRAASHDSINTLRDDHDYSRRVHQPGRVLRVTNMDPTDNDP